jgi:hypothetical protein
MAGSMENEPFPISPQYKSPAAEWQTGHETRRRALILLSDSKEKI